MRIFISKRHGCRIIIAFRDEFYVCVLSLRRFPSICDVHDTAVLFFTYCLTHSTRNTQKNKKAFDGHEPTETEKSTVKLSDGAIKFNKYAMRFNPSHYICIRCVYNTKMVVYCSFTISFLFFLE